MTDRLYSYKNFDIDINGEVLPIIVWGIWAGILIAVVLSIVCRSYTGGLIRRLKNARAVDRESAKTLRELGLSILLARLMLGESSSMFRYIRIANEEDATAVHTSKLGKFWQKLSGHTLDLRKAKLYLPEERRIEAEMRYVEEKHPVRSFVISAALLTAGAVFAAYALPELLLMLDNLITMSK